MNILIVGATGAVGSLVANELSRLTSRHSAHADTKIYAMTRRQPQADVITLPFSLLDAPPSNRSPSTCIHQPTTLDTFICTLGTTLKQAGSREVFAEIDHHLVIRCAQYAQALGAKRAIIMSSVGADSKASSFYLQTKGKMENSLAGLGFEQTHILRPSLLLAQRGDVRPAEILGGHLSRAINPLLIGPLRRFRSIQGHDVAKAICQLTLTTSNKAPHSTNEYDSIIALARQYDTGSE